MIRLAERWVSTKVMYVDLAGSKHQIEKRWALVRPKASRECDVLGEEVVINNGNKLVSAGIATGASNNILPVHARVIVVAGKDNIIVTGLAKTGGNHVDKGAVGVVSHAWATITTANDNRSSTKKNLDPHGLPVLLWTG
jgi:hypothetical protein